jgi:hypothetical protein
MSSQFQQYSGSFDMLCRKKTPRKPSTRVEDPLFLVFWHSATADLHSRIRFSAVPHIIPASQVLSKEARPACTNFLPRLSKKHRSFSGSSANRILQDLTLISQNTQPANPLEAPFRTASLLSQLKLSNL